MNEPSLFLKNEQENSSASLVKQFTKTPFWVVTKRMSKSQSSPAMMVRVTKSNLHYSNGWWEGMKNSFWSKNPGYMAERFVRGMQRATSCCKRMIMVRSQYVW